MIGVRPVKCAVIKNRGYAVRQCPHDSPDVHRQLTNVRSTPENAIRVKIELVFPVSAVACEKADVRSYGAVSVTRRATRVEPNAWLIGVDRLCRTFLTSGLDQI